MHYSILALHLWLSPVTHSNGHFGAKATVQLGDNLWLKLRISETQSDLSSGVVSLSAPKIRFWAETDF